MNSLTVQLEEPIERELRLRAEERGMPLEEFARAVLEREVANKRRLPRTPSQIDPEGWAAALREWAASHPRREGIVIDDSRETIYGDDRK
jgi:hypothetical protein